MNPMQFIQELTARLKADTPNFFIALRWITGMLGILGIAVKYIVKDPVWHFAYAAQINAVCNYFVTAALVFWGSSFLPVKDQSK